MDKKEITTKEDLLAVINMMENTGIVYQNNS